MRILAIQDYLRVGGTESQFLDLTARWSDEGHEVQRLVFRRGGGLFPQSQTRGPAPEFLQPFSTPWNWWSPGLMRAIRKFQPERVIAFGRNAHWSLGRKLRQERIPGLVATMRTGRPLPGGYRRVLASAEAVVTNSAFASRLAEKEGAAADRVRVIENGCRLAGIPLPSRREARADLGVGEDEFLLLCLGSFVPGKAQNRFLKIWQEVDPQARKRIRLWFVGDGPRRSAVESAFQSLPDADRVRFWGSRSDPEKFLAAADGLASVSQEESSPNALVEGLWSGVPIVATRCAGVEELVSEAAGGCLLEDSPEGEAQLAAWISSLPSTASSLKARAEKYQSQAQSRFDPTIRAREYLNLFQSLGRFPSL